MRLLAALVGNSLALLATVVVPGIDFEGGLLTLLVAGALFGLFNVFVRPLALIASIPLLVLSLGLFYLVLNGLLLWAASWFLPGYSVDGVLAGILGSLVITVVNWALATLTGSKDARRDRSPHS